MYLQMERGTVNRHDYSQKQKTKDICKLSEQSKTDCLSSLQMETQKSDTLNNNITFGQCKYNSNALEDISISSSTTFGGFFSKHTLQQCRLCTLPRPIMMLTSIFDNHYANRCLKMIEMYLPIKMHKNDGLPHYICSSCFEKLDQCYDSLNKFRNAYNKHRQKIILTDEQSQIDTTPVPVSPGTKSSESNNDDKDIQNDNKIEANLQYSKLLPSQIDRISHNLSEHLLESEININKQADTHVKNNENQCGNKDENVQNNGQSLDFVVGSSDSENDGQVNQFSATECTTVNTDTTDVCSVKSTDTTLNNINVSDNDMDVSKLRLKKINELTYSAESNKYQVQHRDNSRKFTVNIATKENTPSAAPVKRSTNDNKSFAVDKIKLMYECSFCRKLLTSKKKLVAHCISVHKTSKDEKITCRQLKTIITGNGIEPSLLLNDENIRTDNTDVGRKDPESAKYAYECGQCWQQLTTKEDLVSHCVANKCFDAQNKIVCRQVKLKSTPAEVRYQCNHCDVSFTEPRARIIHTLECHSEKNTAKNSNEVDPGEVRYKTGDGIEPSLVLNDENIGMDNTDGDRKDSERAKYAYECGQCWQQLATQEDLVSHCVANKCFDAQNKIVCRQIKLKSTPTEVRYKCTKCNVYFAEHRGRVVHMLMYHSKKSKTKVTNIVARANKTPENPVTQYSTSHTSHTWNSSCLCMYCGVIRTSTRLIQHERIHTNERPYECAVCLKTFRTPNAYAKHKEIHSTQKNYICHRCGGAFRTKHRLSQHMKTHMSMEERPFRCEVCDKRFGRSDHYRRHKMRHTEIMTEHKCSICHKLFNSAARLSVHLRRAHVNNVQYTCHECGKTFQTKYKFTTHVYLHTGEKPYKCNICDKAFRCRATRNQHSLVHTSDAPYGCEICGKRFKRPGHLKLHKQTHCSTKPYICLVCGKAFRHKHNLNDHQMKHTGERPYKCHICDKAFRCRSTRHQHGLVHTSDAPYVCDVCDKRFKRPGHLKLHRQTHSSYKSYICLVCGKAFQRKQGLNDHQKEHTGGELQTEAFVSV